MTHYKTDLITIEPHIIVEAQAAGLISLLRVSRGKQLYFAVQGDCTENSVLVHLKDNRYTVINRYILHRGKVVDLVDFLYYFKISIQSQAGRDYLGIRTGRDNHNRQSSLFLHRVIVSLYLSGVYDESHQEHVVHHKSATWDNRIERLQLLLKTEHTHLDSHRRPLHVATLADMVYFAQILSLSEPYSFSSPQRTKAKA